MTKAEARQKCLDDPIFLGQCLGYDIQEDVHRELFDALETKKGKRLVLWQRGAFKTSCVVVYAVLRILRNPDIRILAMQAALKLTKLWVKEMRSHFDGTNAKSRMPELFPEFCGDKKALKGSDLGFTSPSRKRKHLKEATVTTASPRATQTGQHYDLMLFDDLVNTANFRNVELLDKLESEFYHFLPLLDPGGDVLVTGTRYSHADIYARIIAKDKGISEWEISVKGCYKADGSLVFPQRTLADGRKIGFTPELLASLKRDDPEMFAPQYLNQVMMSKDQLFPRNVIMLATKSSQDKEYPNAAPCVMTVDLAESQKTTADSSVIAIGSADYRGRVWCKEMVGGQFSPHILAQTIIAMYFKWRPVKILVEKQPGAEFFGEFLRTLAREKGLHLPIDYIKVDRQKNAKTIRIAALENAFKTARLFLLAGLADYEKLSEELEQFPRGRHEDRPDCLALLFNALSAQVPFQPTLKRLSYIFDVPHSTESPSNTSFAPCGDGFVC
jgi:predicted phage terminase large subunit-like protein